MMKIPVRETLRAENSHLREEVRLLKSIVINLDRKVTQNQNDIIDLKSRSMKHNILIHNLAEEDKENLFIKSPALRCVLFNHLYYCKYKLLFTIFFNISKPGLFHPHVHIFSQKLAIFWFWFCHYRGILSFRYLFYCTRL